MRSRSAHLLISALLGAAMGGTAFAGEPLNDDDYVAPLPSEFNGIEITDKLGDTAALDAAFVDDEGRAVTLRDYTGGDLPIILTFNYSSCPMLCSVQLNGLVTALEESAFVPGRQFQLVTVVLDPDETTATVADKKAGYVARFAEERRGSVAAGWHFLTGTDESIHTVADSVGFGYKYDAERDEYLHPATIVFMSADGVVTRYVHGLYYDLLELNASIVDAGVARQGGAAGFFQACFHYEPPSGKYSRMGERTMRYGALGFVVIFFAALLLWLHLRLRSSRAAADTESPS